MQLWQWGSWPKQDSKDPILSSTIASEMDIPRNFLSKILNRLAQAELNPCHPRQEWRGQTGPAWGSDILLHEVVDLFMKIDDYKRCFLGLPKFCDGSCGLHLRWRIISEQFEKMLHDTTIDNIL